MGALNSVSPGAYPVTQLVGRVKDGVGPKCHAWPRRVSPPRGEAQLAGRRTDWQMVCWRGTQASSDNAQDVIQNIVDETGMCAATPNWCTVLSCRVNQG